MKRFLILACLLAIGLGTSDGQAQVLRRRSRCGAASGCNVNSSGCNVSSSGCNLGASQGCNISPAAASVVVPAQLPAVAPASSIGAGASGGSPVQRLFEQAAGGEARQSSEQGQGCAQGQCRIGKPVPAPQALPAPPESACNLLDVRRALAFCTPVSVAAVSGPMVAASNPIPASIASGVDAASVVGAFR